MRVKVSSQIIYDNLYAKVFFRLTESRVRISIVEQTLKEEIPRAG